MSDDHSQSRPSPAGARRRLVRACVYALAGMLALGAAVLGGVRILLPEIQLFRPEIEGWVSGIFQREVRIGAIDAYWRGWTPVLRVEDVRLAARVDAADGERMETPLRLAEVHFAIDPAKSMRLLSVQPFDIYVRGASVVVMRRADGTFSVEGFGGPSPGDSEGSTRIVLWALDQSRLSLLESQVVWIDGRSGSPALTLDHVTLHIVRGQDQYRFSGSFRMPEEGRVEFVVDVSGNPLVPAWTGTAHSRLHEVGLQHVGLDARSVGGERIEGRVSGEVWSTWSRDGLIEAEGTIRAVAPAVVQGESRRGFDELSGVFRVGQGPDGWELGVRDLVVATPAGEWPRSNLGVRWTPSQGDSDGTVVVSVEYVQIDDLAAVLAPGGAFANPKLDAVIASAPRGVLEDLRVSAPITDRIEFARARARGRFAALAAATRTQAVSVEGASGEFEASAQGLVADVAAGILQINLPRWFAHPLRGEGLTGAFVARPSPEGLRIRFDEANVATSVGTVTARGSVLAPRDRRKPLLDIAIDVDSTEVAAAVALLTDRVLPQPVARWLERAAPDGDIRSAQLLVRHRSAENSAAGDGLRVEAAADLAFPTFRYAAGWPEIVNASGRLQWRAGRQLEARIESGRILDSNIRAATITIADLKAAAPEVHIVGSVDGTSGDAVRFLTESPLRSRFAAAFDGWTIGGESTLDLDLALRFEGGRRAVTVGGEIVLADNRVTVPALGRDIESVAGAIRFGNAFVESDGLTGMWHGEPLRAVIGATPGSEGAVRLSIEGRMTRPLLAAYLHDIGFTGSPRPEDSPILARFDGDAAWNVTLDIPPAGRSGRAWLLSAVTDLQGAAVDLPPPFGKPRESVRVLTIESPIAGGSDSVVLVRYGSLANAALALRSDAGRRRLERGMVRLDAQPATTPDTAGISIHGALPVLDGDVWLDLLGDIARGSAPNAGSSPFGHVGELSIGAESATAFGARFPDIGIRGTRGPDGGWRLEISGRHLEGSVNIPRDLRAEPISADLDRMMYVPYADDTRAEREGLDPRTLPGVSLSAGHVIVGEYDLGSVRLTTAPTDDGMKFERIEVQTGGFKGDGTGSWSVGGEDHRTEFNVRIYGDDLGKMLDALGYEGGSVDGGVTDVSVEGAWPGTPRDFAAQRLRGVIYLHSTDGHLTQINPGVPGRVFGLLTFTSLPRRLLLDFGDLFSRGIEFDRIEGSFALENGHAYTDNLVMESNTARIDVVGRTGLVDRDYDKLLTVTPKISSGLPFVPIWMLQKLLDRNVFDKAFAYQYTVTGSWDDPAIELVRTERLEVDRVE